MATRLQLHQVLRDLLGNDNVYFQAPPNNVMKYPCVIYNVDDVVIQHADNRAYKSTDRYQLMFIERDPDAQLWRGALELPLSDFVRAYPADNLHHTLINLHF